MIGLGSDININGHEKVIQTRVIDKEEVISLTFGLIEKKNNNYRSLIFNYSGTAELSWIG